MREIYESKLLSFSEKPVNIIWHPNSDKIAIIMDPRYDKLMVGVIKHFMQHLNPFGWNLMIITHEKYAVKSDFPGCKLVFINEERIYYNNNEPNINIDTYNGILLSKEFWDFIPGEHIFIFQKDCYMYKMFDETIYLNYAFCGATCIWLSDDNYGFAINGGCSLRKKSEMLDCLQKISWDIIEKFYPKQLLHNEDLFFTFACTLLQKNILSKNETSNFAVENEDVVDTCFYHGWNKDYQTMEKAQLLMKQ